MLSLFASAAILFNLFGANWSPTPEAIRADFLQAASASTAGQATVIVNGVTVGDGWSDGVEVQVIFDIIPQRTTTLRSGLLSGLQITEGRPLKNGIASLSYAFTSDDKWKHLTTSIERLPTE